MVDASARRTSNAREYRRMSVRARIIAITDAVPEHRVDNAELAVLHPRWGMGRLGERTGVLSRAWCGESETALDLALTACERLATHLGGSLGAVDAVLFCTQTPDYVMPPNACLLQTKLGLSTATAAFDFTLACSGYVYGLYLADALIRAGSARRVLLVTAETYSKWMHPGDRGPMTLFGDGAAATLLEAGSCGLEHFVLGTDGTGASSFCVPAGGARRGRSAATATEEADQSGNVRTLEHLHMNGNSVLDFVKVRVPKAIDEVLRLAHLTRDDIDLFVFHQGSTMTLEYLNRAARIPVEKQYSNLAHRGNTVSASLPLALVDACREGRLVPGMRVLLCGFGVGLSWGACLLHWEPNE